MACDTPPLKKQRNKWNAITHYQSHPMHLKMENLGMGLDNTQYSPTLHTFNMERYVGWGCILNCFMLSSLFCFPAFCWSAIPTSH